MFLVRLLELQIQKYTCIYFFVEYLCVWGGIIPAAEQPFTKITSENEIKIVIQKKYNSGSPDIKQEAP